MVQACSLLYLCMLLSILRRLGGSLKYRIHSRATSSKIIEVQRLESQVLLRLLWCISFTSFSLATYSSFQKQMWGFVMFGILQSRRAAVTVEHFYLSFNVLFCYVQQTAHFLYIQVMRIINLAALSLFYAPSTREFKCFRRFLVCILCFLLFPDFRMSSK